MDQIVYNIPVSMIDRYPGRNLVLRSHDPQEIVGVLSRADLTRISYVQVLSIRTDLQSLTSWGPGIPVDLVIDEPAVDLPLLYRCSPLAASHPVRVTGPVVSGLSRIVKLAVSLNFAVKLEGSQADEPLIEELLQVANFYLHQAAVARPIEYFHSLFMAFLKKDAVNLWDIQEENPANIRFITDVGMETLSRRFAESDVKGDVSLFFSSLLEKLTSQNGECQSCEFLEPCSGYFKWPDREYRCDGMKAVFRTLKDGADELQRDLGALYRVGEGEGS